MSNELTHIDESGGVRMVDVSEKAVTERRAVAVSSVTFTPETFAILKEGGFQTKKGSLIQTAIIAGISGVKRTSELIPLCHNIPIDKVDVYIVAEENVLNISCEVKTTGKTGVEMEALTGASVAALCIYDMCKALSQQMSIGPTYLVEKTGGKNDYRK
jgi:cyclic pyranopterin phosphate synthase